MNIDKRVKKNTYATKVIEELAKESNADAIVDTKPITKELKKIMKRIRAKKSISSRYR